MKYSLKAELIKRIKSLSWRTAAFLGAGLGAIAISPEFSELLKSAGAPVYVVAAIALVVGEITKSLNNYLNR